MNNLVMQCPACSKPFQVSPDAAGQTVACPSCQSAVMIPGREEPNHSATAPADTIVYHCPECDGPFGLTPDMRGKRIACPHCEKEVTIESEAVFQETLPPTETENELFAPGFKAKEKLPAEQSSKPADASPKETVKKKSNRFKGGSIQPVDEATGQPINDLPPTSVTTPEPIVERDTQTPDSATRPSGLPTMHGTTAPPETGKATDGAADEGALPPLAGTLPAPFLIDDPQRVTRGKSRDTTKVMLPDEAEGTRQLDRRLVKIEYKGQTVELISRTPEEQIRYRNRVNFVSMLLGLLFILIAFVILLW